MKRFHGACFGFSSDYVSSLMLGIESFSVDRLWSWNEIEAKMKPQGEKKKKAIWLFRLAKLNMQNYCIFRLAGI